MIAPKAEQDVGEVEQTQVVAAFPNHHVDAVEQSTATASPYRD